jgi:hypothetical protein
VTRAVGVPGATLGEPVAQPATTSPIAASTGPARPALTVRSSHTQIMHRRSYDMPNRPPNHSLRSLYRLLEVQNMREPTDSPLRAAEGAE